MTERLVSLSIEIDVKKLDSADNPFSAKYKINIISEHSTYLISCDSMYD